MDKIDVLLKEISTETPKINPYLNNLIYEKAIAKEGKKNSFFFKKPLLLTLTSIVCIFIIVFSFVNINTKLKEDQSDTDSSVTNPFVPTLSPSLQNTVLIDYHFTLFSEKYDIVTLFINNKINYKRIYIKAFNLSIDDLKINNGDVTINQVTIENQTFFEVVFNNKNSNGHYLDLCFEKDTIKNILKANVDYVLKFIMYIDEVDAEKGYGYDFNVEKVYDLREGNNI